MHPRLAELAWAPTRIGDISLRRRLEPVTRTEVYEVKLGDEYLMSSLFTVAEEELARLGLAALPSAEEDMRRAVDLAVAGVERLPWSVRGVIRSPVLGGKGATEFLLHAVRAGLRDLGAGAGPVDVFELTFSTSPAGARRVT